MKSKNVVRLAKVVGLILLVPLFGNLLVEGWNWTAMDFIFAAIMLFGTGLAIDFSIRNLTNPLYRAIVCLAIILAFLFIWIEVAVGIFD